MTFGEITFTPAVVVQVHRQTKSVVAGVQRAAQGRQRAMLFELGAVLGEVSTDDGGWDLELKMAERDLQRFLKRENLAADVLKPVTESKPDSAAATA